MQLSGVSAKAVLLLARARATHVQRELWYLSCVRVCVCVCVCVCVLSMMVIERKGGNRERSIKN